MDHKNKICRILAEKQVSTMSNEEIGMYLNLKPGLITDYHKELVTELLEYEKLMLLSETNTMIKVGIYYYIDENGKKIYDEEAMKDEFQTKLTNLLNN